MVYNRFFHLHLHFYILCTVHLFHVDNTRKSKFTIAKYSNTYINLYEIFLMFLWPLIGWYGLWQVHWHESVLLLTKLFLNGKDKSNRYDNTFILICFPRYWEMNVNFYICFDFGMNNSNYCEHLKKDIWIVKSYESKFQTSPYILLFRLPSRP